MVVFPAIILASLLTPVKYQDRLDSVNLAGRVDICRMYRKWQKEFDQRYLDVIDDKIDYLSWNEFVKLKEGNIILELEDQCNN